MLKKFSDLVIYTLPQKDIIQERVERVIKFSYGFAGFIALYAAFNISSSPLTAVPVTIVWSTLAGFVYLNNSKTLSRSIYRIELSACKSRVSIWYDLKQNLKLEVPVQNIRINQKSFTDTNNAQVMEVFVIEEHTNKVKKLMLMITKEQDVFVQHTRSIDLLFDVLSGRHEKVKEYEYVGK